MRKLSVVLLSLLFILCAMLGISACNSSGDGKELPSSDIYKKVNPSVALVSINKLQGSTSGTGFFIDNNGTLVTNYNVIKDGVSGKLQLHNGTTADIGNVLGYDETLNIAVLETKATSRPVAGFAALGSKGPMRPFRKQWKRRKQIWTNLSRWKSSQKRKSVLITRRAGAAGGD